MITAAKNTTDDLSDEMIVKRMATGDTQALEILMRRYNQALYRATRSILKDEHEAEEAVQDTYLKAYRAIGNYRGDAKLATWLTRIAINEALSRLRKRKHRAEVINLDDNLALMMADETHPEENSSMQEHIRNTPENVVLGAEVRRLIEQKIDHLPDAFRTVFVLRVLEEFTVEETAACLNIPEATVRSRHFRARGLLREALAREIDFNIESAFSFAGERCDRIVAGVLDQLTTT